MGTAENFKQYAADCVRQAEGEQTPEDKNILLNMALAWVRLAQQATELNLPADDAGEHRDVQPAEATAAEQSDIADHDGERDDKAADDKGRTLN